MACLTKTDLENAKRDADDLASVVNGPSSGASSQVTTRLGTVIKTLARVIAETAIPTGSAIAGLLDTYFGNISWRANRESITANRTYYVNSATGSDSNTGLSSGTAFATLQKAWDTLAALDLSTYTGNIIVADGTYTSGIVTSAFPLGGSAINITGNSSTPANCYINSTAACFSFSNTGAAITIDGFKLNTSGSFGMNFTNNCIGSYKNIEFVAASTTHVNVTNGAVVTQGGNVTISGNATQHWSINTAKLLANPRQITISTPVTFTQFVLVQGNAVCQAFSMTFVNPGNVTGKRYTITGMAIINTGGGGANYFPGTTAGTATFLDQSGVQLAYY